MSYQKPSYIVQRQYCIGQPRFNNRFGHAKHSRRSFILSYYHPTLLPNMTGPTGAIMA
ncbi:hypothetical protein SAMN06265337_1176 [Hymenobacter gelipurpurascens]|uniref:Uncharacterized protein n=1 Tax=Hymenobacter gelipurpurascens TaxID=89968 RepID=A0A212TFS5_9BACT|nr:hypothetical protein SAMN06265337_1176 [Hymenobacter gelipurpurascens]